MTERPDVAREEGTSNPLSAAFRLCTSHFGFAAGYSGLLNLLYLAPTLYMLQVYDRVVPTRGKLTLLFLTLVVAFALATLSVLDYYRSRLLVRASARLDHLLSGPILRMVLTPPARGALSTQTAMRDFDALRQAMTGAGILALFDAPWTPVYVMICFGLNPLLGGVAFGGVVVLLSLTALNERATKTRLKAANEANNASYLAQEFSRNAAPVVAALGMREALVQRHLRGRMRSIRLQAEASFYAGRYLTLSRFVRLFLQSLALGVGAYLAIEGKMSPGAVFAASLLVTRAISPAEQVIGAWKSLAQARVAFQSLDRLFEANPVQPPRTVLPRPQGRLQVQGLTVQTGDDTRILNGVDFTADAGEIIGLIGPSGAGKSTMVRAVVGASTSYGGSIRLDGADVRDWDSDRLARYMGYLPQDSQLMEGTIKENISRFRTELEEDGEALDEKVVAAAKLCGAHEMILALPKAYETKLGYGGAGLSAGQAQRIALARALFDEPAVVLLDEPNAHLDSEGEASLVQTLQALKQRGATVFVVAHRTGVLAAVDKVMIMRAGRIEAFGPRDEIVQRRANPLGGFMNAVATQAKQA